MTGRYWAGIILLLEVGMSDKLEVLNFILQTIVENKGNIQKSLLENKLTTKYGNDNIVFFHNLISELVSFNNLGISGNEPEDIILNNGDFLELSKAGKHFAALIKSIAKMK